MAVTHRAAATTGPGRHCGAEDTWNSLVRLRIGSWRRGHFFPGWDKTGRVMTLSGVVPLEALGKALQAVMIQATEVTF